MGASVLDKDPCKKAHVTFSSAHTHQDPFQASAEYNLGSRGHRTRLPQLKGKLLTQWREGMVCPTPYVTRGSILFSAIGLAGSVQCFPDAAAMTCVCFCWHSPPSP